MQIAVSIGHTVIDSTSWFFISDVIDFGMRSMQVIVFWESDDEKGADYGDAQGLL